MEAFFFCFVLYSLCLRHMATQHMLCVLSAGAASLKQSRADVSGRTGTVAVNSAKPLVIQSKIQIKWFL